MLVSSKVAKIIKPSALLVWLMLYFLVVPSCLFGHVICFGVDGHIELEIGQNGRCGTRPDTIPVVPSLSQSPSILDTEDHCGRCLDIILLTIDPDYPYAGSVQGIMVETPSAIYVTLVLPIHLAVTPPTKSRLSIETWQSDPPDCQTVILRL